MKEQTENYESPQVEIVEANVEKGFASSPGNGYTGTGDVSESETGEGEW